ncbi:MAG: endonuclease MutS2 [Clostridia bacterium]|nr:endonuclease MutS2 [Clostridia bacterium]
MPYTLKHIRSLELDKILAMLAKRTACPDAAEAALALVPTGHLFEANELMQQTVDAHMLIARFGAPSFGGLTNIKNALARADASGILSMGELLTVASVLHIFRTLKDWRSHSADIPTCLNERFDAIYTNRSFEEKITTCIISEEEMSDRASPALADIRRKISAAQNRARDRLEKMVHSSSEQKYLQDSIITMRDGRFVVPVKQEYRSQISGLVHDTSSSGATLFIEPMEVVEANNEIRILRQKEKQEIERILAELSADAGGYSVPISTSYEICVELNLIFAKAQLAYEMNAVAPILSDDGIIELKKARHPLLAKDKVVPTDIRIGDDFDTLVITGPNTGGKTVSLKTLGLLTLMAECGLMLPVSSGSRVSVFENVLADIGDEQSIEQSLSTFSAHMTNIIAIIAETGQRSLVLLDELGAGTDPVEGAALAVAVLEHLRALGAKTAATTHYAEIKEYALRTDGVMNASCEFDVNTLSPTYRLLIGLPGRSNAFAILERLGMEPQVIERAKSIVPEQSNRFEDILNTLEVGRIELEKQQDEARRQRYRAEQLAKEADEKQKKYEAEREKELQRARDEARRIVDRTRAQSERLISELEELRRDAAKDEASDRLRRAKAAAKAGMNAVEDEANPVVKKKSDGYVLPRALKVGDVVLIADIDKKATVTDAPKGADYVFVQAGIIRTKVNLSNLRLLKEKPPEYVKEKPAARGVDSRALNNMGSDVDLRGLMVDEALPQLDLFIDNAVLCKLEQITIIHGKGTGALRAAVRTHLRKHPSVKTFRPGVYGEGEDGVTIAALK